MNDFELPSGGIECALALQATDVNVVINGIWAETVLIQKYRNDTKKNLEISYTFPLPVGGVLLNFTVLIGSRQYKGQVLPRTDAENKYENAISDGNAAFRIQEIRKGMYSATLGNVVPGEAVNLTITYAETLRWSGNRIRYHLPTTIAPRYGNPSGMQPWQRPETRMDAEYPLSIHILIQGALSKSAISSPSHKISFKPNQDLLEISLAPGATMDRDFILEIENGAVNSLGISASARDTHVALVTLLPPPVESNKDVRDTVIVLDCSGSMEGDSLELAKEGVQLALGALNPNEHFAILAFGDEFLHFDKEFQPANKKNLKLARSFISQVGNLGGTELKRALELALEFNRGQSMDILLLTDGESWEISGIVDMAREKNVRIFTMGIGSAVAEDTVRALADGTEGACELVSPTEDMAMRIFNHFSRMRQPKLSSLTLSWPTPPLWEIRPNTACFAGDAYTVVAAFKEEAPQCVSTTYVFADKPSITLDVELPLALDAVDAIVNIAANARLPYLEGDARRAWAVLHQLISDQTDYIVTIERSVAEKSVDLPELQIQPQMLPAGWGGASSIRKSMFSAITQLSRSINDSSFDDDPMLSMPRVRRSVRRSERHESSDATQSYLYLKFLNYLNDDAAKITKRKYPNTKKNLMGYVPPAKLVILIDEMLAEGHSELNILNAVLQALIEHDGAIQLSEKFNDKIRRILSNQSIDLDMVNRFRISLNEIWKVHDESFKAIRRRIRRM